MHKPIEIKDRGDVEKVLKFAEVYGEKCHVSTSGAAMAAASSILGLLSLIGKAGCKLVFEETKDAQSRNKQLKKIAKASKVAGFA
jgi:phosphotransferase system HPr-like phosphotransfer protein